MKRPTRTYTVRLAINRDDAKVSMTFRNIYASDADEAAAVCVIEAEKTDYRGWVLDGPVEAERDTKEPTALARVLAAAERHAGVLINQAADYELLADKERVKDYGNAKAGSENGGRPFETAHDRVAAEIMRDHYRPLREAIEEVRKGME